MSPHEIVNLGMVQGILVGLIFLGAVAYLGYVIYQQLQAKATCATGCGKCSVVDFKKIEKELRNKELLLP